MLKQGLSSRLPLGLTRAVSLPSPHWRGAGCLGSARTPENGTLRASGGALLFHPAAGLAAVQVDGLRAARGEALDAVSPQGSGELVPRHISPALAVELERQLVERVFEREGSET